MNSRDKAQSPLLAPTGAATSTSRRATTTTTATKRTPGSSLGQANKQTSQPLSSSTSSTATSAPINKRTEKAQPSSSSSTAAAATASATSSRKNATKSMKNKTVIDTDQQKQQQQQPRQRHNRPPQGQNRASTLGSSLLKRKPDSRRSARDLNEDSSSSSQEMTITSLQSDQSPISSQCQSGEHLVVLEQETNIDRSDNNQATDDDESTTLLESCSSPGSDKRAMAALTSRVSGDDLDVSNQLRSRHQLPAGWEEHTDKEGLYYWHKPTGLIQRARPTEEALKEQLNKDEPIVLYHDDEEINQTSVVRPSRTSSDEDDYTLESGAALTLADETTLSDAISFVVYPIGCCEFDETQLISANSTKAIQKCILRLMNRPNEDEPESMCWGLNSTQPILMRLLDDHIQFTDISTQTLLRSQPIGTIKTWAVDDDNNFAFVVEDDSQTGGDGESHLESVDYALLTGPTFMCYVFSSMEDDDMSLKVATKLNKDINRYRMQMSNRISKCTRLQQMIDPKQLGPTNSLTTNKRLLTVDNDQTDADEDFEDQNDGGKPTRDDDNDDDDDDLAESSEMSMNVRYIGMVQVPRPMGIDVLNVAIDKCLAAASKAQMDRLLNRNASTSQAPQNVATTNSEGQLEIGSPLTEAKIHVSPSSVIVENEQTGEIIVECRIRYLTFMGISRRDIRWCGFIMQNTTNQTFVAHCFECHPTAGHVCEAIQQSCSRMYEKMVRRQKMKQQMDDVTSILPKSSKIRDTLAKTLSKIKLTPLG